MEEKNVKDKKEKIFVPKGAPGDDPNLLISINGKNYVLPRGKASEVPAFVAAEFHRSEKAQERFDAIVASKRSK